MIKVGDNYRIKDGRDCWILEERRTGTHPKTKEPTENWTPMYYPNFRLVANRIVEREAKQASDLYDIVQKMNEVATVLAKEIEKVSNDAQDNNKTSP